MQNTRKIIHIDMDCFFAAVEERENPQLQGKAVAVGGSAERRGVISTANYQARQFGVHSAMSTRRALQLCPDLILVCPNFKLYRAISTNIRQIFKQYTDIIEPLSVDEAFLDVSGKDHYHGSASFMAAKIRQQIWEQERLTASAGIAPNKFLAKVASDWNKPNGQKVVAPHEIAVFVAKLPVNKIFGVGPKTVEKLQSLGIRTCKDMQEFALENLTHNFGKFGERLYQLCRGIDDRELKPTRKRKSLSIEETFPYDLTTALECKQELSILCQELDVRLERVNNRAFNKVFVKIKFADFTSTTVEKVATMLTAETTDELLQQGLERGQDKAVRLLGVGVRFKEAGIMRQLDLF